ncbi:hypothetical protein [Croceivirga sp. JEA036]|uniref:hypothetical protein n=1 Tax=Croceivirga sp. JEA036 TaxID=2721162 RepID=UPI00143B7D0E|nr:hypothetical protein [Croceivirga sp. JEA036]NJB37800.1 hypothetical protein [Croceivirga sp. JEA036]
MGIKKSLGFQLITIIALLSSCGPDYNEEFIDFVIINESGVDIVLNPNPPVGEQFPNNERSSLMIENNDAFSELMEISTRNANFSFQTFFGTNNVEVIFGNERRTLYSCVNSDLNNNCDNPRNILTFRADSDNRAEYTFIISDFESATPCDGPCN